jgi:simple sugar transport system ATP-binding protein
MIHQHFMLVPHLSVAENIILGLPSLRPPLLNLREAEKQVDELARKYRLTIDSKTMVSRLPVGLQQRVEILKALYRKIDILILDEPTSVLTPLETTALFEIIGRLTKEGLAVIFISHKLNEVMAISSRITVLRRGRVVATTYSGETDPNRLAGMMVGKEVNFSLNRTPRKAGRKMLEVQHVTMNTRGKPTLKDVSFDVCGGEIFGIAGVDGNGQVELAEAIAGLSPVSGGRILIDGRNVTHRSPRERIEKGLAYIPADRQRVGTIMDLSVEENLVLKSFCDPPYTRYRFFLRKKFIKANTDRMARTFNIKISSGSAAISSLSGGNQQKVILAREISGKPAVLIAVQPTRGLDVGSANYVHQRILEHREAGGATMLISTELDEVVALCDRFAIMYEGEIMDTVPGGEEINLEEVSLMMAGYRAAGTSRRCYDC